MLEWAEPIRVRDDRGTRLIKLPPAWCASYDICKGELLVAREIEGGRLVLSRWKDEVQPHE